MRRTRLLLLAALMLTPGLIGCSASSFSRVPSCGETQRVGLIAQSVPSSSYVPCVAGLAAGWQSDALSVRNGRSSFQLLSDRAEGRPVFVVFRAACATGAAVPIPPRTSGGRSYLSLRSMDPRYSGIMYDVFPGGCVTYRFDFHRGAHIALMAELQSTITFISRAELRRKLRSELGVELDP